MDSNVIPKNYANNPSISYGAQIIELMSEKVTYGQNIGRFVPPYITPSESGQVYERTLPKQNISNILNRSNNLGLSKITVTNYIDIEIPKHLFTINRIEITTNARTGGEGYYVSCNPQAKIIYNEFYKGQKFLIVNLGGNLNKPYIIGVA